MWTEDGGGVRMESGRILFSGENVKVLESAEMLPNERQGIGQLP